MSKSTADLIKELEGAAPKSTAALIQELESRPPPKVLYSGAAPLAESALSLVSGAAASIPAGLAGVGQMAYDAATGRPEAEERAGSTVRSVQDALTYRPRTAPGRTALEAMGKPFEMLAQGADAVGGPVSDVAGPVAGAAVNTAIQMIPAAMGGRAPAAAASRAGRGIAAADVAKAGDAVLSERLKAAQAAGLKVPPTLEGAPAVSGGVNKAVGAAAGPGVETALSIQNARTATTLGRKALGVADDVALTEANLGRMKAEAYKPYEALRNTGVVQADGTYIGQLYDATGKGSTSFPGNVPKRIERLRQQYEQKQFTASHAVDEIQKLRQSANKNIKADNAALNDLGFAQRKIADALEGQLERHAETLGQPKLVADLRAARKQLARIHSVDDALTPWGDVSPRLLSRQLSKGVPLDAELKLLAESYDAFSSVMKDRHTLKAKPAEGVLGGVPRAVANATVGPIARGVAGSDFIQGRVGVPDHRPSLATELMAGYGGTNPAATQAPLAALQGMSDEERRRRLLAELLKQ